MFYNKITLFSMICSISLLNIIETSTFNKIYSVNNNNRNICTEKRKIETDKIVSKILAFGQNGRLFPTDDQELKSFCRQTSSMIEIVEKYFQDCSVNREQQNFATVFIYSLKHVLRTFCRRKKSKKVIQFLQVAPCLNKYIHDDRCISGFSNQTKPLIYIGEKKFEHICCNYVAAISCVDTWVTSKECSRDYHELLIDYVRGIFDNMITVICGDNNDDSDKCEHVNSKLQKLIAEQKYDLRNNSTVPTSQFNSFMFIIMDIFDSLDKNHRHN